MPPRMLGRNVSCTMGPKAGWGIRASGIISRLTSAQTHIALSQRRKLPVMVMAISPTTPRGTERYGLMPKYCRAIAKPINSVTMVKKFRRNKIKSDEWNNLRTLSGLLSIFSPYVLLSAFVSMCIICRMSIAFRCNFVLVMSHLRVEKRRE